MIKALTLIMVWLRLASMLGMVESQRPLHSAIASARLTSILAVDTTSWSSLSQGYSLLFIFFCFYFFWFLFISMVTSLVMLNYSYVIPFLDLTLVGILCWVGELLLMMIWMLNFISFIKHDTKRPYKWGWIQPPSRCIVGKHYRAFPQENSWLYDRMATTQSLL